jgi:hypothetical protein
MLWSQVCVAKRHADCFVTHELVNSSHFRQQARTIRQFGYDPREEVKSAAAQRWVDAVNAEGSYGQWRYTVVKKKRRMSLKR